MSVNTHKKWTAEEDEILKDEYPYKGAAVLAKKLGRSMHAIHARSNFLGVKIESVTDLHGDKIKELASHGFTIPEISASLKLNQSTVRYIGERNGVKFPEARTYVDKKAIELGIEEETALPKNVNQITFADYYKYWYNTYRKDSISEVTRYSYRNVFAITIEGGLGDKKLNKITRADLQNYISWYGKTRSKQTVYDHLQYIRSCFKDAVVDGYITNNPSGNITPVYREQNMSVQEQKRLRDQKKWLEVDEYQKLRYYLVFELKRILKESAVLFGNNKSVQASKQILGMIVFLGLKTGARLSEIVGLTRNDVDFEENTINIDKTFDYKRDMDGGFKKTKNLSSIREILVDKETIDLVEMYIDWLDKFEVETKENTLFMVKGHKFHNSTINCGLARMLKELDIERISMHKLRHTHASYLISQGVPLQVIAKRLGHTDTNMIQRVYGHLLKETEETGNKMILNLI